MKGMNNIALNDDVYEQCKVSCEELEYKDPDIDINDEIAEYVESLRIEEDHVRENKLKTWITAKVQPVLTKWERKYAGGDKLLNNIHTEINKLEQIKDTEQLNVTNLQDQITIETENLYRKEKQIQKAEQGEVKNGKIDLKYEKMKAIMFLVFSFLVAFGTYTYFIKGQIEMDWAVKSQEAKISNVEEMIRQGESNYFNTFKIYIKDSDDEIVKNINAINDDTIIDIPAEVIYKADAPSIWQGIKYHPNFLLLSIGAFLLILFGKIVASIYEKLGYPNWMYYTLAISAFIVLIGAIYVQSSLGGLTTSKTALAGKITTLELAIEDAKFNSGFSRGRRGKSTAETDTVIQLKKELKLNNDKLKEVKETISSYKPITMFLFMLVEILIGSIAWMTYAEYIEKKMRISSGGEGTLFKLREEKEYIENKIKELKEEILERTQKIKDATELENKLASLVGDIHSKAQIKNISKQYLNKIIADGEQMLQKARVKWQREGI